MNNANKASCNAIQTSPAEQALISLYEAANLAASFPLPSQSQSDVQLILTSLEQRIPALQVTEQGQPTNVTAVANPTPGQLRSCAGSLVLSARKAHEACVSELATLQEGDITGEYAEALASLCSLLRSLQENEVTCLADTLQSQALRRL